MRALVKAYFIIKSAECVYVFLRQGVVILRVEK